MARRTRRNSPAASDTSELSVQPFDLSDPRDATSMRALVNRGRGSGANAWKWYNTIPEIHYAISRSGRIAGYAEYFPVKVDNWGQPGRKIKGGAEAEAAARLSSPYGGRRGLTERFFTLMKVPGEAYLIRCRDAQDNIIGYDWVGAGELASQDTADGTGGNGRIYKAGDKLHRIVLPSSQSADGKDLVVDIKVEDFIGRVWRPGGQHVFAPDSPLMSLDSTCELLDLLHKNIRAKLLSRFALNGIFFVPSEITQVAGAQPQGKNKAQVHDNRILDRLIAACTWAVQHHEQPEAAVPIFMTGPGQYADMIKHITYDRAIMETDMALRAELVEKILRGLDSNPTSVTGSQDASHWGAWASADEELRVDVKPEVEQHCWALTRLVLHRELSEAEMAPGKITGSMIWYDLSAAQVTTNVAEDTRQAMDRGLIGPAGARRRTGIPETDAPTEVEYIRWVGVKTSDPYLATYGLPEADKLDWEKVGSKKTGPDANSPAEDPKTGPGSGTPGSPDGGKSDTPRKLRPA